MTASPTTSGRLLCLGTGYVARATAAALRTQGWRVAGTTRNPSKAAELQALGVDPIDWEEGAVAAAASEADALLVSTPPMAGACPSAGLFGRSFLASGRPRWIGYLSSTAAYGDHQGGWVDEETAPHKVSPRGAARLAAEAAWRRIGAATSAHVVVFRIAGIYGPGRSAIDTARAGAARRIVKPGHVLNRIQIDDIVAALLASLAAPGSGDLFNLADDEPAPSADVVEEACRLLNLQPPPIERFEDAELSEAARGFFLECKRVRNNRLKTRLSLALRHPSYREGLRAILRGEPS